MTCGCPGAASGNRRRDRGRLTARRAHDLAGCVRRSALHRDRWRPLGRHRRRRADAARGRAATSGPSAAPSAAARARAGAPSADRRCWRRRPPAPLGRRRRLGFPGLYENITPNRVSKVLLRALDAAVLAAGPDGALAPVRMRSATFAGRWRRIAARARDFLSALAGQERPAVLGCLCGCVNLTWPRGPPCQGHLCVCRPPAGQPPARTQRIVPLAARQPKRERSSRCPPIDGSRGAL